MINDIKVTHVVPTLHPRAGGPSRTVVQIVDALATQRPDSFQFSLLTQSYANEPSINSLCELVNRIDCKSDFKLSLILGYPLRRMLLKEIDNNKPCLIHSHGIWMAANYWSANIARNLCVPYIVQPRGMLEPWAMSKKSLKKKIAMGLFQRRDLALAKVIVATSREEYKNIRFLGFTNPIAVIPNGIEFHKLPIHDRPFEGGSKKLLFLSRVHPKKGLINLVKAWASVSTAGWCLQIAGPDEDGHLSEVMVEARHHGIQDRIEYLGEVDGDEKIAVYQNADIFVLPTFSENFGVVVAEALSYGLPVITTKGAPWADLPEYECGWWIDIGLEPLVGALREAMSLDDAERHAMGERGKTYVKRYDWKGIAQQTLEMYSWVLDQGPKPDFIYLD